MKKVQGFTLIEILIALTVFAILAGLTSSSLYYAFTTRTRVNAQAEQLNALQLTVSLIQQDVLQIIERPIRGNEMHLFPAFIGQNQYVEFTRDGNANPQSQEQRSTLKRIALVCEDGTLRRRTWETLDSTDRNTYEDKILLRDLTHCHFAYLNQVLQLLPEWQELSANLSNVHKESLPRAIQMNITVKEWGEMNLLFTIPGGLYAST